MKPTDPTAFALRMELEGGLVPVLARLSGDERLTVLAAIDLAFACRNTALGCLKTVNLALSQAANRGTGLDPAICDMLMARTTTVLKHCDK